MASDGSSVHAELHAEPLKVDPNRSHGDRHHLSSTTDSQKLSEGTDDGPTKVARTAGSGIPDTGWAGQFPSHRGGDSHPDFMKEPPYSWNLISLNFKQKYHL
ncbi:hypothetical protein GSI_02486 [Ganoderma sinense ZZ0214-1]|uniref:Uncharacterized protein n=1 Tax=Ganoderma sinense ZZ0214-1 TaxID=1077348 RepID=A0A2G8SPR2_9APHY|nr:hypothetical protein GSI_02486 [Ganoderma sinense ZZ0214-1]